MKHIALFLHEIHFNGKSGRLIFKLDKVEKYFFFQEGNLIQIKTNQAEERLGEVLYRMEKITREAYSHMDDYIEPNINIGEVLKIKGVITDQDLSDALAYQLRVATLNAFSSFNADITFQERKGFSGKSGESQVSIPFLIEYGIRTMPYNPALKLFLVKKIPKLKKKQLPHLLAEEEKKILERITGSLSSDKIIEKLTVEPEFFWRSLFLFYCLDIIELDTKEAPGRSTAEAAPEEPAPAPQADGASQIADVIAMRESLPSSNYYQILNVPKTASEEEIKKAYFTLARKFHPDRFDRTVSAAYRSQIEEVFDGITNAYRTLSDKEKRRLYDLGTSAPAAAESPDLSKKAEIKFRQGKTLFAQERFEDAVIFLEEAVRIRRDKGDYYLLLAMAESKIPTYRKKAEEDFLRAIAIEAWNPEAYVGLGILYKNEGMIAKATRQFQKALEVDSSHKRALQELNQITAGEKKKGFKDIFSRDIFGSKKK